MSIADNLGLVRRRIQKATEAASRPPGSVQLLAVSKTRGAAELRAAIAAGQRAFGENYLQEALDKMAELEDEPGLQWHFIGPIQSNKTRTIAAHFDWVHSIGRLKIAQRLDEQRPPELPPLSVCLQVNSDNQASKSGVATDAVAELAEAVMALPRLRLRGLMTIPDPDQPEQSLRRRFGELRELLEDIRRDWPEAEHLDTLSMGMSADLEAAIAEGATWVRVGTALFGARS